MDFAWPFFLILMSPAIGSFLGVLVDRLPKGESILTPSRCAACGARLGLRDLVPVVSFLMQKGRCRHCETTIPGHLLRIEVAAFAAACVAVATTFDPIMLVLELLVLWCLIALFYTDLLHMRLPNLLTLALLAFGLALAIATPDRGLAEGALSASVGFVAFWILRRGYAAWRGREGMGMGDVKLMAGVGAAVGWAELPALALIAALMALATAGVEALGARSLPKRDAPLPFGCFLTGAAALMVIL